MSESFDIVDVTLLDMVEVLYPGWNVMTCEALLSDGESITGTIHTDGLFAWDLESFVADNDT